MESKAPVTDFQACANMIYEQRYGAAMSLFLAAVRDFHGSKISPKRGQIARHLLQIATALEDTLKKAYGEKWESRIPKFTETDSEARCSFCGKGKGEVVKLIAGPSVHICDECVGLCGEILTKESPNPVEGSVESATSNKTAERLCGICMEARDEDELIFLPHAAYMCASCLDEIQDVRDTQSGNSPR